MSYRKTNIRRILCGVSLFAISNSQAQTIDVKAYKTRLTDVMDDIGRQSRKKIILSTDQNPLISIGSKESSLAETLKKIENLYGFSFEINNEDIVVKDKAGVTKDARGLASIEGEEGVPLTPLEQRANGHRFRSVNMNYQDPAKVIERVKQIVGEEIKFLAVDDKNKAIVFYGNEENYRTITGIVEDVDVQPPQILLAARVVEATSNFSRNLGVSLSRSAGTSAGNLVTNNAIGDNLTFGYKFGIIDAVGLDATLQAGESNGEAKTISSPQVITSDNVAATISSDNTISVKIGTAGSATESEDTTAGSLQSVTAGLNLNVTPKVLRGGRIHLKIDITNSQFDNTSPGPDGVPNQTSTGVKTEMIVKAGQTASIAGIYKKQDSDKYSGVPLAMNVPLFGWLFKNNQKSDTRQEIMAFISPTILELLNEKSITIDKSEDEKVSSR